MKKSLRQMVLVGLSTSLLASVAVAPVVWAQDDASESTEQVGDSSEESSEESTDESAETSTEESSEESTEESSEGSMEESSESTTEESVTEEVSTETSEEVAAVEASLVQQGVEEAIAIFQEEYPDAEIEEIDVELDRDADDDADVEATEAEEVYQITISGFDAEDNDFELEIEWVNGAIREQAFNEGMFNTDTTDSMDTTETTDTTAADTETSLEETSSESMSEESVEGDTSVVEETPATDEATERRGLDLEALITLDEAVEIAMAEYGEGEITNWNLTVDDPEWYEFWEDGYENPIWTIDIEDENEADDDKEDSEVRIDAVSGDIINLEDIDSMDSTESSSDTETSSEESSE